MKPCRLLVIAALSALSGCDWAQESAIQPLPPATRPSPEARLGLPEIEGQWYFAGWDLPISEPPEGLAAAGALWIETQRLDSLAGAYLSGEQRLPLLGEVRRDSVFSLVVRDPNGGGSFLAGRALRDTIWVELTSLAFAQKWPMGTRGAFVRDAVERPFTRLPGGAYLVEEDTTLVDTLSLPGDTAVLVDTAAAAVPVTPTPPPVRDTAAAPPPAPRQTPPADTAARTPPQQTQPRDTAPRPVRRDTVQPALRRDTTQAAPPRDTARQAPPAARPSPRDTLRRPPPDPPASRPAPGPEVNLPLLPAERPPVRPDTIQLPPPPGAGRGGVR
ncbi:hypothetical protein BH23GEM7_BH23GEM7_17420 [soil metagenome]